MRDYLLPLLALTGLLACSSLSREDRIAKLIREDLNTKIADFTGYEALSTQIGDSIFDSARVTTEALGLAKKIMEQQEKIKEIQSEMELPEQFLATLTDYDNYYAKQIQYYKEKIEMSQGEIDSLKNEIRKLDASIPHKFIGYGVTHRFRFGKEGHKQLMDLFYVVDDENKKIVFTVVLDQESEAQIEIINEALALE